VEAFAAAFVFGVGKTFFWPVMLGVTARRFPKAAHAILWRNRQLVHRLHPSGDGRVTTTKVRSRPLCCVAPRGADGGVQALSALSGARRLRAVKLEEAEVELNPGWGA
jgi:hypothetical protein